MLLCGWDGDERIEQWDRLGECVDEHHAAGIKAARTVTGFTPATGIYSTVVPTLDYSSRVIQVGQDAGHNGMVILDGAGTAVSIFHPEPKELPDLG